MLFYKKALDITAKANGHHAQKRLIGLLKEANIFAFTGGSNSDFAEFVLKYEINDSVISNLPFKTCWFECPGKAIGTWVDDSIEVLGILVHEGEDLTLYMHVLTYSVSTKIHKFLDVDFVANKVPGHKDPAVARWQILSLVRFLLNEMEQCRLFKATENLPTIPNSKDFIGRLKAKNGTPRDVIYVASKDKKSIKTDSGVIVHYSHAFEVRGHWRKISESSLGKDREGDRGPVGRTWVKAHVKGDKSAPVIKKTRVIN